MNGSMLKERTGLYIQYECGEKVSSSSAEDSNETVTRPEPRCTMFEALRKKHNHYPSLNASSDGTWASVKGGRGGDGPPTFVTHMLGAPVILKKGPLLR